MHWCLPCKGGRIVQEGQHHSADSCPTLMKRKHYVTQIARWTYHCTFDTLPSSVQTPQQCNSAAAQHGCAATPCLGVVAHKCHHLAALHKNLLLQDLSLDAWGS
jgi:hypothetical protein